MESSYYIDKLEAKIKEIQEDIKLAKVYLKNGIVVHDLGREFGIFNIVVDSSLESIKNLMKFIVPGTRMLNTYNKQDKTVHVPYSIHVSDIQCKLWIYSAQGIYFVNLDRSKLDHIDAKQGPWLKEYDAPERTGKWGLIRYQPLGATYYPRKEFTLEEFLEEIKPLLL